MAAGAARLSVNVNKVATLRNSRGGRLPSVIDAVRTCIDAGAPGITVHPRADERHITRRDVLEIADELEALEGRVELNIEGDPRPDLIELVMRVRPDQCTLVPVVPGEITSQAGWPPSTPREMLGGVIERMASAGIRVSVFVDPQPDAILWARSLGADRVELYTEPYARAWGTAEQAAVLDAYARTARAAQQVGLGVNAGHDLNRENLPDCFEISAETAEGEIMGMRHRSLSIEGVQFHPESILTTAGKDLLRNFLKL